MKFINTVAVLGTAAFLQFLVGTAAIAEPKTDLAQQATDKSLAAAISKLKNVQLTPVTTKLKTETSETLETSEPTSPSAPPEQQAEKTTPPAQKTDTETEDVITLDLITTNKDNNNAKPQKQDTALKKTAQKQQSAGSTNKETSPANKDKGNSSPKVTQAKLTKEQALARRKQTLARAALGFRGTPYVWGGETPKGFDCSGFVQYLYKKYYGIKLPRTASQQYEVGKPVSRDSLSIGDLVFFRNTGGRKGITHVGMYIGNNKFIHAANPRKGVRVDTLTGYYSQHYASARRYR